jgi:lipoprotein-anchoring transpeptidase ErfK/SrfK
MRSGAWLAVALVAGLGACRPAAAPRRLALVDPEIIVSIDGLTVHLFDRTTGTSFVFAAHVGGLRADGTSVTPVGHFRTGDDPGDRWWYMPRRTEPARYRGMPFLRLTARNPRGEHVYGLHGPVDGGPSGTPYVSRGCVRLAADDIVALFELVRDHPATPVTIQEEVEVDAAGQPITVGITPVLWPVDAEIPFGASVGPRPE